MASALNPFSGRTEAMNFRLWLDEGHTLEAFREFFQ
jgi:hypothetical protein